MEKATFAAGCFWCVEAVFKRIKGVSEVKSGYSGGDEEDPSYREVSAGKTEHAEAVQITYDPKVIDYKDLVYIFFRTHDATEIDKQGPDVGHQYRSVIFYHTEEQKKKAEDERQKAQKLYDSPIATKIEPFKSFYEAEEYHKNYYERNKDARYCKVIIDPKIQKLQKNFKEYLKDEDKKA
jgi:peptide-methionine (S)-S-oxide reductase